MKLPKIATVIGARPQFIKASAISAEIAKSKSLNEILIHTGQHFDLSMSDVFFEELKIPAPQHNLGIHGGSHGQMTGRMLEAIETVLVTTRPDYVLVYGDTNSTLAGALAAVKLHIPVAHVEAGLRSFNMSMPEEVNRVLTDHISNILFSPTEEAEANLLREGVRPAKIAVTGDVMYDVARLHSKNLNSTDPLFEKTGIVPRNYILATVHRAENTDTPEKLRHIVAALSAVSSDLMTVVWPVHPRTRGLVNASEELTSLARSIRMIGPVGYLDMLRLERFAAVIATDSGGVQKEAFFQGVPCVTLRTETEWTELVSAGWNRLAPPDNSEKIIEAIKQAIGSRGQQIQPYGRGDAAERIVRRLCAELASDPMD